MDELLKKMTESIRKTVLLLALVSPNRVPFFGADLQHIGWVGCGDGNSFLVLS